MHRIRAALAVPRTWDRLFETRRAQCATESKACPRACKDEIEPSVRQRTRSAGPDKPGFRGAASLSATCYSLARGLVDFEEPR